MPTVLYMLVDTPVLYKTAHAHDHCLRTPIDSVLSDGEQTNEAS